MSTESSATDTKRSSWLFWLLAAAILATAFAVRWHVYRVWDYVGSADQSAYLAIARGIAAWRPLTAVVFTPGFPAIAAVFMRLGCHPDRCGQLATLLCGVASVALIGALAARFYGRRPALLAMAIAAVHPDLVRRSANGMSEMPYATILLLALLLLGAVVRGPARRGNGWLLAAGGVLLGWLYLTRPEGIGVGAAVALALLVGARGDRRQGIVQAAVVVGAMLLAAAPYMVWLHTATGHWTVAGKTQMNLGLDERSEDADESRPSVTASDGGDPTSLGATFRRMPRNLAKYVREAPGDYDGPLLFAAATLGLLALPWRRRRAQHELLMLAPWVTPVVASAFFYNSRFVMVLLVIVIVWAGAGLDHIGRWCQRTCGTHARVRGLVTVVALSLVVLPNMPDLARLARRSEVPLEEKPAAQWLKAHVPAGTRLINGKTMVPFYAEMESDVAPHGPPDTVYAAAVRAGDEYLIVGERQDAKWWPTLMPFTDDKSPRAGFSLVYQSPEKPRVLIYRVLPPSAQ